MDTQAHLLSLGWAGPGHALDARPYKQKGHRGLACDPNAVRSTGGNGLVKPLLISQRKTRLGVGRKQHEPPAGSEWWLAGFEKALGNIGKSEGERTSGSTTPISNSHPAKGTGLYGFFVKGQAMEGTIRQQETQVSKKRKSGEMLDAGDLHGAGHESKGRDNDAVVDFEKVAHFMQVRDKDRKRRHLDQNQDPLAEFEQVGHYLEDTSATIHKAKDTSRDTSVEAFDQPESEENAKEARRARRRRRREEKATRKNTSAPATPPTATNSEPHAAAVKQDTAAEAARRAEKKRRKEQKLVP